MALSVGAPIEFVTFLCERAADSQEIMLERDQSLRNRETILVSIESELEQAGYEFAGVFKERSPAMERTDIALNVTAYKTLSPSERIDFAVEHHAILSPVIESLKKLEDSVYNLGQALYEMISGE